MMKKNNKTCSICEKKLTFFSTALIKYKGKIICNPCARRESLKDLKRLFFEAKEDMKKIIAESKDQSSNQKVGSLNSIGNRMQSIGKKLTIGLTIPIVLFVLGLLIFPIGILFWLVALVICVNTFFSD